MPYDLSRLLPWCLTLTWVYAGASALYGGYAVYEYVTYRDYLEGVIGAHALESKIDLFGLAAAFLGLAGVGSIAAFVVNGVWLYRASANARAMDPQDRITPGWTVGWFCIPIANLWMPYRAIKQVWLSSMEPGTAFTTRAPAFFAIWWTTWVLGDVCANISFRLSLRDGIEPYMDALLFDIASTPFNLVAAYFFLRILRTVTEAQQAQGGLAETFA